MLSTARRTVSALVAAVALTLSMFAMSPIAHGDSQAASQRATLPAGRLVYVCGADLCAVDPASGASQKVTSDGAGYLSPDITPNGALVAADRGDSVVVGAFGTNLTEVWAESRSVNDVAIAPDGSGVAESHSYVQNESRMCWPGPYLCLQLVAHNETGYAPKGDPAGGPTYDGGNGTAFTPTGGLLSGTYDLTPDLHAICYVATPALPDQDCVELFASTNPLTDPDISPDGTLVAVTSSPEGGTSSVNLYASTASQGAAAVPTRVISDARDAAFSPDGAWLAYAASDGWIRATPTAGGASVKLAQGVAPTWGGGAVDGPPTTTPPTAPPTTTNGGKARIVKPKGALKVRKGALRIPVKCKGDQACKGRVKVTLKGKKLTKPARYSIEPGHRSVVKAKLTRKGAKALRKNKGRTVKVQVKVKGSKKKLKVRR